ncbi:MAG: ester cyclase, partial [Thermomicrobiales bacterium]
MAPDPSSIVRAFIATVWNAAKTPDVHKYIHPEYSVDGQTVGQDWVKANVEQFRLAFPDLTVTNEQIVATDETVAARLRMQGTHLGQWKGIAP